MENKQSSEHSLENTLTFKIPPLEGSVSSSFTDKVLSQKTNELCNAGKLYTTEKKRNSLPLKNEIVFPIENTCVFKMSSPECTKNFKQQNIFELDEKSFDHRLQNTVAFLIPCVQSEPSSSRYKILSKRKDESCNSDKLCTSEKEQKSLHIKNKISTPIENTNKILSQRKNESHKSNKLYTIEKERKPLQVKNEIAPPKENTYVFKIPPLEYMPYFRQCNMSKMEKEESFKQNLQKMSAFSVDSLEGEPLSSRDKIFSQRKDRYYNSELCTTENHQTTLRPINYIATPSRTRRELFRDTQTYTPPDPGFSEISQKVYALSKNKTKKFKK